MSTFVKKSQSSKNLPSEVIMDPEWREDLLKIMHSYRLGSCMGAMYMPCYTRKLMPGEPAGPNKRKAYSIARFVAGALPDEFVYPLDGDPFNCKRENLGVHKFRRPDRPPAETARIKGGKQLFVFEDHTFPHTYLETATQKWIAKLTVGGFVYSGRFDTQLEAAAAADWVKRHMTKLDLPPNRSNKLHSTGVRGVYRAMGPKGPTGKFIARITHDYTLRHLGTYDTLEEAQGAVIAARAKLPPKRKTPQREVLARFDAKVLKWRARVKRYHPHLRKWRWASFGYFDYEDDAIAAAEKARDEHQHVNISSVMRPA